MEEEKARSAEHVDKRKSYAKLQYAQNGNGRNLQPTSSLREHEAYARTHTPAKPIENFLANIQISPCDQHTRGITWLELYILYRSRGYPKPIADPINIASAKASPAKQIQAFKKYTRGVIARSLGQSPDAALFRPRVPKIEASLVLEL